MFVVFEGIDGAGKSLQTKKVSEKLMELGHKVYVTCEPTKMDTGLLCRTYLKKEDSRVEVDALLFAADRVNHYYSDILPKLKEGFIVISDRYVLSSIVYQQSQGADESWLNSINKFAPNPDLTIFLDITQEIAIERLAQKTKEEREKFENLRDLITIRELYKKYEHMYTPVDAGMNEDDVAKRIVEVILKKV